MKEIEISGANRFETFTKTRAGSRAVILRDGMILLSHETVTGWWLVPGGGMENGETSEMCCVREVEEETGYMVRPLQEFLTLYEYYEEYRYISHYFICEVTGQGEMNLTDAEKKRGLEPQWIPLQDAIDLFSHHQDCADVSEEQRGSYLREYTALLEYMNEASVSLNGLNDGETVRRQYQTSEKLKTRISIHNKYSTNKQGFGNWIASHYQIREGVSLLELGCGTGEMWTGKQEIISRCVRFVLSDFSEGMLCKAKETLHDYNGIEYRIIDIQDIPFEDRSFDIVIANMMLYHVPDLAKGLREVSRILKDDGSFYCATYGENGMMTYINSLFRDYQVQNQVNRNFTLQNGEEELRPFFSDVKTALYKDSLEVTDVEDLVDYIFSLTGMTDLRRIPREKVRRVLENNMSNGILYVPKEYGMFIAKK